MYTNTSFTIHYQNHWKASRSSGKLDKRVYFQQWPMILIRSCPLHLGKHSGMEGHDAQTLPFSIHKGRLCGPLFNDSNFVAMQFLSSVAHHPSPPYPSSLFLCLQSSGGARVSWPYPYATLRFQHRNGGLQRLTPMQHGGSRGALVGSSAPLLRSIAVPAPHRWVPAPHWSKTPKYSWIMLNT